MKKKTLWRVLTAAMAAATLTGFSLMTVSAANTVRNAGDNWVGSDYVDAEHPGTAITTKKTITVTNVKDTAADLDVVAYQLVKGTYLDGKLTGYVLCDQTNASIANMEQPTATEITTIANAVRAGTTTLTGIHMTKGSGAQSEQYTAQVEAGLYIVLVNGSTGYVYNPAVVAVNVTNANQVAQTASGGTVSLTSYWNYPANAYLKSTTSDFNKDIVSGTRRNPGTPVTAKDTEGDIVNKGDIVTFVLNGMTVPDYTDEYASGVIYQIDDKLEIGSFAGIDSLSAVKFDGYGDADNDPATPDTKINSSVVPMTETGDWDNDPATPETERSNYTIVYKDASGAELTGDDIAKSAVSYTIRFSDTWLRENKTKSLEITYNSNLLETAHVNGQANKSVATLRYTVNPSDNNGVEVLRDSTYHYTFEIGGLIDGSTGSTVNGGNSFHGYEINKVTEAKTADYTADPTTHEFSSPKALRGAEFTLYDDEGMTQVHKLYKRNATTQAWEYESAVYTTVSDGHIVFSGLDEGTYYLKETAAPSGYTLNANQYKIVIAGTLADGTDAEQGTLTGYTITTSVKNGSQWDTVGTAVNAFTPAVTKPDTDAAATNFDAVTNTATNTTSPAEVIDTRLAELPATGGVGTIIITVGAAIGMTVFLSIYLVNRKKKKEQEEE